MAPIIMLGDSITEGFPTDTLLKEFSVVNRGVGGNRTDHVLERLNRDVIDAAPSAVFLLIGINDIGSGFSNNTLLVNYERMVLRITKNIPNVKLFLMSILPTRGIESLPLERIQLLNVEIHKLAMKYGVKFLDIYPMFIDAKGELAEEFTGDGLHLTLPAYEKWANYLRQVFATML
ncbi:MAG TPA: GDSL-type esterase/lipase family protein [Bacteroidota bacterium]|nr:GDSL-type esterase/lipase family protein [Bacteroidota bacterium]